MELPQRIKHVRGEMTQKDFAASIGVAVSGLQFYEAGRHAPSYEVLLRIIEVYNVDPSWLLTGKHSEARPVKPMSADQQKMLRLYDKTDAMGRKQLLRQGEFEAARVSSDGKK